MLRVISDAANQEPIFEITDTKLYVPALTISFHDNTKISQ